MVYREDRGGRELPVQLNECPVEIVLSILSGRWKIPIYRYLYKNEKPVRYSELLRHLPSISKKILTEQLRELERDGIIERKSYPEPRPRVEYGLTSPGRSMIIFLDKISEWGEKYIVAVSPS
ncbi:MULTISPECIES: helix-turn-helix domain-containing protein [unclassified Cohnella]|uniref:winged helix-turn-helix transcriptional regulator n=1 Tax=Cohnella sp. OV330 TaxID=1855288 RepID=UPI000B7DF9EC